MIMIILTMVLTKFITMIFKMMVIMMTISTMTTAALTFIFIKKVSQIFGKKIERHQVDRDSQVPDVSRSLFTPYYYVGGGGGWARSRYQYIATKY